MGLPRDLFQRPLLTDSALSTERFGYIHPALPWRQIIEAYDRDLMDVAMQLIESAGVGFEANQLGTLLMIEAEAEVRSRGKLVETTDWLALELVPDEANVTADVLLGWIR